MRLRWSRFATTGLVEPRSPAWRRRDRSSRRNGRRRRRQRPHLLHLWRLRFP